MEHPELEVRPLRVEDDSELAEWHAVMVAAATEELTETVMGSLAVHQQELRRPIDRHYEVWVALTEGRVVGAARANLPLSDNLDKAYLQLYVDPSAQGRGVGSALLAAVERGVRARGRTVMVAECIYPASDPQHRYLQWGLRRGYTVAHTEIYRICPVPVPESVLAPLEADAQARIDGYRLVQYVDAVPDPYTTGYCGLSGLVAVDAPTGALEFQEEAVTPAHVAARVARLAGVGQHWLLTLALDGDDQVVAFTELYLDDGEPDKADQWGTFVHRSHRGHRLGTAVKVANIRLLQDRFRGVRAIHTSNDETNQPMVDINVALGFQIYACIPELMKAL